MLREARIGLAEREAILLERGYPAYTTSPGWLGYSDDKLTRLAKQAVADGFTQIKLKVGADLDDDIRRLRTARAAVGDGVRIAIDANQCWDVDAAIAWVRELQPFDLAWIEEPTSPDDLVGHALGAGRPAEARATARRVALWGLATGTGVAARVAARLSPARRRSR